MEYVYGMIIIYLLDVSDKTIKIIEIKKWLIVKDLIGHNNGVLTIRKIIHPKYGECLISQNWNESEIKLWINEI